MEASLARPSVAEVGCVTRAKQLDLDHHGCEVERGLGRRQVQRSEHEQVPKPRYRLLGLALSTGPWPKRLAAEGLIVAAELLQPPGGPRDADSVGEREEPVAREPRGEIEGCGQPGAPQRRSGPTGKEPGDVKPLLKPRETGGVEPVEQPPVGGATAAAHVLAHVDREVRPPERRSNAA